MLNKNMFTTQNNISVTMKASVYFELGMVYNIIIPSDMPGNDAATPLPDPVLSGTKILYRSTSHI